MVAGKRWMARAILSSMALLWLIQPAPGQSAASRGAMMMPVRGKALPARQPVTASPPGYVPYGQPPYIAPPAPSGILATGGGQVSPHAAFPYAPAALNPSGAMPVSRRATVGRAGPVLGPAEMEISDARPPRDMIASRDGVSHLAVSNALTNSVVPAACQSCGAAPGNCGCGDIGDSLATTSPFHPCGSCGDVVCGGMCLTDACGPSAPTHRFAPFVDFIYLRPRDAQVAYAVPIDGPVAATLGNGIQVGPAAVVDIGHHAGFRVGGSMVMSDNATLGGTYTHFESSEDHAAFVAAPFVMRSLITHPLGNNVATDTLRAAARHDIDFDLTDVSYRGVWHDQNRLRIDYLLGLRYGQLDQQLAARFETNGLTQVDTELEFNGAGPVIGLLADRPVGALGLYFYGKGDAAFLVGESAAAYRQNDATLGNVVDTHWEAGRVVSQLAMELGLGWQSATGRARLACGYQVQAWYNAVRTDEFIQAVQSNNFVGLGDGLTFDGLTIHGELRF